MRRLMNRRGQSTLEYAIVIGVVAAALVGMQAYLKRGMQGRLRESADDIGGQYSPTEVTSSFTTTSSSTTTDTLAGGVTTSAVSASNQARSGSETVLALPGVTEPEPEPEPEE